MIRVLFCIAGLCLQACCATVMVSRGLTLYALINGFGLAFWILNVSIAAEAMD